MFSPPLVRDPFEPLPPPETLTAIAQAYRFNKTTTPAVTATDAPTTTGVPAMTGGPRLFSDDFGPNRNDLIWQQTAESTGVLREIAKGVYHIRTTSPRMAVSALFDQDSQYASHFQYEADFTISKDSQPDTGTGIVFRYLNEDNYYVFGVNGQGQVSIWSRYKGVWKELRNGPINWTPAEGVRSGGQMNHVKLADYGDRFQATVNDNMVIDMAASPMIASGAIGVYVGTTSMKDVANPLADITVDNWKTSEAFTPAPAATRTIESMTGPDDNPTVTPSKTIESMTGPQAPNPTKVPSVATKVPTKNVPAPVPTSIPVLPIPTLIPDLSGSTGSGNTVPVVIPTIGLSLP
jgi:hypothetical protein